MHKLNFKFFFDYINRSLKENFNKSKFGSPVLDFGNACIEKKGNGSLMVTTHQIFFIKGNDFKIFYLRNFKYFYSI